MYKALQMHRISLQAMHALAQELYTVALHRFVGKLLGLKAAVHWIVVSSVARFWIIGIQNLLIRMPA